MLTLWLLAGSLLAGPPAVPQAGIQTQTDPVRQALAEAADLVAAGDTSGAIGRLELAVESRPDEFQLLAELAWLYGFQASYVPEDFRERKAAEDYALRAWKLEPGHPSALGALALVRLKQLGPQNSGQLLDRALASPRFADLPADRRADVYYVQGLRYAREARDFEGLVRRPEKLPVATPTCSAFGLFCRNFSHPAAFNEMLERAGSLDFLAADERHQALEAFRTAVRLDPPHIEALSELLLILADDGAWGEYLQYARRGVEANPEAPRTHLLLGLGLHRSGHTEAAAESFERGLALLSPELRDAYGSPLSLLSVEDSARLWSRPGSEDAQNFRAIWAKLDPLYLTGANERWVEHLARVTHADLKFGEQGGEIRGSETDPGRIYVRYGPPR
ncbi:MAG: GWxTD domain-containing protein, partial [Gemmatimonadetes bacterium]|nr:GWxTD domain-containing protein [Gemmatimonadota bacterium]NIR76547.1 GWxTD domain-containing protein [Candidatus Kutchimonas denitrificans]NIS01548.1 GWxTD domain-containing protein [Gemmatimonadota bacterium]NIT67286.1 GWxTD domain-containing protein [Gemmatimonadota bacterium]NIU54629.1 GWxTD domain-containing protein [Gemmatimonadota bacterium]